MSYNYQKLNKFVILSLVSIFFLFALLNVDHLVCFNIFEMSKIYNLQQNQLVLLLAGKLAKRINLLLRTNHKKPNRKLANDHLYERIVVAQWVESKKCCS